MERIYKIVDLTLCVNATIKTIPFYVWRDVIRFAYASVDLSGPNAYSQYSFANRNDLNSATEVLNGAIFTEVTEDQWEQVRGQNED